MTIRESRAVACWVESNPLVAAVAISLNGQHRHVTAVEVRSAEQVQILAVTPGEPADVWTNIEASGVTIVVPVEWVKPGPVVDGLAKANGAVLALVNVANQTSPGPMIVPIVIDGDTVQPLGLPAESVWARFKRKLSKLFTLV